MSEGTPWETYGRKFAEQRPRMERPPRTPRTKGARHRAQPLSRKCEAAPGNKLHKPQTPYKLKPSVHSVGWRTIIAAANVWGHLCSGHLQKTLEKGQTRYVWGQLYLVNYRKPPEMFGAYYVRTNYKKTQILHGVVRAQKSDRSRGASSSPPG